MREADQGTACKDVSPCSSRTFDPVAVCLSLCFAWCDHGAGELCVIISLLRVPEEKQHSLHRATSVMNRTLCSLFSRYPWNVLISPRHQMKQRNVDREESRELQHVDIAQSNIACPRYRPQFGTVL